MNFRAVFHLISFLPIVLGAGMLVCWGIGAFYVDPLSAQRAFALSAAIAILVGAALWAFTRGSMDLSRRDGVGVVTFGWLLSTLLAAVPFILSETIPDWAGAWFESVSGLTTTGGSVMSNLEHAPHSILLWRALTHFMGGMGILVLVVAILPLLGSGGMQIFRAEVAGPSKDRLTPRIAGTAKLLWGLYLGLNAAGIIALKLCGMNWFDSVCHAFSAVATGGFSTRTDGIAAYDSAAIEWVLIALMVLGGTNFALHWQFLRGRWNAHIRNPEFRLYIGILIFASIIIAFNAWPVLPHVAGKAIRRAVFGVVTVMTTTGFGGDDFASWPMLSQYILLLLMVIGSCAGSTSGGIKVVRVLILFKQIAREMKLFIQPQAVYHVKMRHQIVEDDAVNMISAFFVIFALVFITATAAMIAFTPDMLTAVSSVAATLGNVGPGLGAVGPMSNYSGIPAAGKIILSCCMLLGRLEFYTMLVLFIPGFWRR